MADVSAMTLRMFLENPLDVPLLQWGLFITAVLFLGTCIYLQMKDDSIDLRWLIMERVDKPSLPKIGQVVALLASTWGFVVLVMKGQLTETYFMCYMTVWSGSAALETYFNKNTRGTRRSTDKEDCDDRDGRGRGRAGYYDGIRGDGHYDGRRGDGVREGREDGERDGPAYSRNGD